MTWLASIGIASGIVIGVIAYVYLFMKLSHVIDIGLVYIFFFLSLIVLILTSVIHAELF